MEQTFTFDDLDDGDESIVIVRTVPGGVGLTVSKKTDGDLEVFMPTATAERVAAALRDAVTEHNARASPRHTCATDGALPLRLSSLPWLVTAQRGGARRSRPASAV